MVTTYPEKMNIKHHIIMPIIYTECNFFSTYESWFSDATRTLLHHLPSQLFAVQLMDPWSIQTLKIKAFTFFKLHQTIAGLLTSNATIDQIRKKHNGKTNVSMSFHGNDIQLLNLPTPFLSLDYFSSTPLNLRNSNWHTFFGPHHTEVNIWILTT